MKPDNASVHLNPLPIEEWDNSLSHIIADMGGRPINVHKLMANNPGLLRAWWSFRNYSVDGGTLGKRFAELVILRIATHMKAWYEWGSHVERALSCGISLSEIERVAQGGQDKNWAESEAWLLIAVDELIESYAIGKSTYHNLAKHFTSDQILDVIAIHGMYVILGCMINTWGLKLDDHINSKLPSSVTVASFHALLEID